MPGVQLIFGTYNTTPLGGSESFREEQYQQCIKPFLSTLYLFPEIPTVLYYSGILLQWLEKKHPEFLDVLGEMVSRKQVELLGGAFYDPILTILPRSDALGQIELFTTYLRKKFGKRPRGAWIPELEWEPWLASTLRTCGMDYTFLGEYHFNAAGVMKRYVPYLTEDQGKTIYVFPIFEQISDSLEKTSPKEVIRAILTHQSSSEDRLVTLLVPGHYWTNKKIEEFFLELRKNEQIRCTQPNQYVRSTHVGYKTYFPCGSREQRMVEALPAERAKEYKALKSRLGTLNGEMLFGGGFFRQLLARYPESNLLYAKMQYTHLLVNGVRRDKYRKIAAREELWKGQHGQAYWSGSVSGGNLIRRQAYKSLITAERITREKGVFIPSLVVMDFDMDGKDEFLYQGHDLNAYVHTNGGAIFELDNLNKAWNYVDCSIRKIGGKEVLRKIFLDHFFPIGTEPQELFSPKQGDWGDFINQSYTVVKCDKERSELVLERRSTVRQAKEQIPVRLVKKYIFKGNTINLYYSLTNTSSASLRMCFGVEVNFSFADREQVRVLWQEGKSRREVHHTPSELSNVSEISFEDSSHGTQIVVSTLEPCSAWDLSNEWKVSSADENGLDLGSCFVSYWALDLPSGAVWENRITLKMGTL
ncbi:MAG: DUF1926 domain-containing protein [Spirochaetes bacterium]|nr:DUF1926 domain-containing protein [Spirochaetota bacterium]